MTTTTDLLREIAQHIREEAESLRESHGHFPDRDPATMEPEVREVYDRELRYADALDALADQMERAAPVGTVRTCVWNGQGWTVSLIVPTQMRVGDPLYTHPAPEVTRDAEKVEYGWLVENGKSGAELRYRTWRDGLPEWTADPNEATRFARRIDAEEVHREDEDAWRIVEHAWHDDAAAMQEPKP